MTTDELFHELASRHIGAVFIGASLARHCSDKETGVSIHWKGGFHYAVGMIESARRAIHEVPNYEG